MTSLTIVTGGSRGIGAAISRRLASEGHDVVVGYRTRADDAAAVVADVEAAGRRGLAVQVETTDPESIAQLFSAATELGTVTGLVANAGAARSVGALADAAVDDLRHDVDVNLTATILCCREAIRTMVDGGAIVTISSVSARLGSAGQYVHYAAAKAGVDALTRGLAREVASRGIRVNGVSPGTVWSDFHQDPNRPALVAEMVPMRRAGQPDEIAGAVAWLLSDDASYTTGAVIDVSGGL